MVDVDCVVLELFVEKVDLLLKLVQLVQLLIDFGSQVALSLIEMVDGVIDDGDVLLQFDDVFRGASELQLQCALASIVGLVIEELLFLKLLFCLL